MIEARNTAHRCGLKYVYLGNIYVPACGDTICPNCHATVVKREGYIVRNLMTNEGTCPKCGQKIPGIWK